MAEKFNVETGIKLEHVPTAGAGAANEEVAAGRITYWFSSLTPARPLIRDGKLVALAVSGTKRLSAMPELPTAAESGVAGYESTLWYGVWAPAATPARVVEKISADIARVLVKEEMARIPRDTFPKVLSVAVSQGILEITVTDTEITLRMPDVPSLGVYQVERKRRLH
jgi:tripartite-type tricarboxylate transporter receptor subunit TctC